MLLWWLVFLLAPSVSFAATVYIDPSCANNGDGTATICAGAPAGNGPYNDWGSVTFVAGNTYTQKRGTTYMGRVLINASGSGDADANRIILDAYGSGDAPKINGTGYRDVIYLSCNCSYVTIQNYEIYGADTGSTDRSGVRLGDSAVVAGTGIKLLDLSIHDIQTAGNGNGGSGTWGYCANCELDNITIYNIPTDGINLSNLGTFRLTNSHVYNVNMDTAINAGDCVQLGGTSTNKTVEDNIFDHRNNKAKQAYIDNTTGSENDIVRRNKFWMTTDGSALAKAAIIGGNNTKLYANEIIGGDWALSFYESGTIYGNVIGGANIRGWVFSGNSKTVYASHNTLYSTASDAASIGIDASGTSSGITLTDNIISGFGTGIKKTAGVTITDSMTDFYANTAIGDGFTQNGNSLLVDPQYLSDTDVRLGISSPLRSSAVLGVPCIDARFRTCPPDRPNIGAYQATSGDPAATRAVRN